MEILIRREEKKDYKQTEELVARAFEGVKESDHREHLLVANLRRGENFIEDLSLVAEVKAGLVGHIMFTKIQLEGSSRPGLALAPYQF